MDIHFQRKWDTYRNGKGLTILGWDMKKQGNLLVWIRFWLQENSSVNQTQIIIISFFFFFFSWQILEMLVQGLVCSVEPSIFFLTNQTFRPLLLSDHRYPKSCFNSNLHVVILASKKKERKLEESYFLGKSPESAHVIFMDISEAKT